MDKGSPLSGKVKAFLARERVNVRDYAFLKGDGSERVFVRLFLSRGSLILILPQKGSLGLKESCSYWKIGRFLRSKGLPVPCLYAWEEEEGFLLVEDLGDVRLEDLSPEEKNKFYPRVIEILISFQKEAESFEKDWVLEGPYYDPSLVWEREILYFFDSFLRNYLCLDPPKEIIEELKVIWRKAWPFFEEKVLLHRDFQSRNIMIYQGQVYLIDFQGTRLGPPDYDLASLLGDPYAGLAPEQQEKLFALYLESSGRGGLPGYPYFFLFRLLQALGAYAKLYRAGKSWFKTYIPPALNQLRRHLFDYFPEASSFSAFLEEIHPLIDG